MQKRSMLKRKGVNHALESIFDYPLTIVEAPIGYGKTTDAREFLTAKGVPFIWTAFFSESDTAEAFWSRLAAEIGKLDEAAPATAGLLPQRPSHVRKLRPSSSTMQSWLGLACSDRQCIRFSYTVDGGTGLI